MTAARVVLFEFRLQDGGVGPGKPRPGLELGPGGHRLSGCSLGQKLASLGGERRGRKNCPNVGKSESSVSFSAGPRLRL